MEARSRGGVLRFSGVQIFTWRLRWKWKCGREESHEGMMEIQYYAS